MTGTFKRVLYAWLLSLLPATLLGGPVNINTADAETISAELIQDSDTLPTLGPK